MILKIIAAMATTFGFAIIFNIRGKTLIHTSIAGSLSMFFCLVCLEYKLPYALTYFIAALAISLYAEIISIYTNIIETAILIPALIPLAPGGGIYYTMYHFLNEEYYSALIKSGETFTIAGAMALGVFTAPVIIKMIFEIKKLSKLSKLKKIRLRNQKDNNDN